MYLDNITCLNYFGACQWRRGCYALEKFPCNSTGFLGYINIRLKFQVHAHIFHGRCCMFFLLVLLNIYSKMVSGRITVRNIQILCK